MQHRVQCRKDRQKSDERELCRRCGKEKILFLKMESRYYLAIVKKTCKFVLFKTVLTVLSVINQFSPSQRSGCTLTLGNDHLRYYHVFFGVPKESPYQKELQKE